MTRGRHRRGFTLIEVMMASFILFLFPSVALVTTIQMEKFARYQVEEMAAAAFCEDVYNRCLREENFSSVNGGDWVNLKKTRVAGDGDIWYAPSGEEPFICLPAIRLKGGEFGTPLARDGYKTPQYRVVSVTGGIGSGSHDVRVSLRWGPAGENGAPYRYVYHQDLEVEE